ncbi:MAG: hypothetical protein ACKOE6_06630 [Flammeovirgaceae bacterium]
MKFGFAPNLSVEVTKHSEIITELDGQVNNLVREKKYGEDIAELYIGIVSVSPQFAQFFKSRPPKYTKGHKSYVKEDVRYDLYNSFEFDVMLDFETFRNANEQEAQKMIALGILSSFDVFKKFKKFDSAKFKSDLEFFFKSKGWI